MEDINKLRRFSLVVALLLIFYEATGISLEEGAKASIFGIPFVINNPEYLSVGFLLASLYGFFRYYYYALMLADSPYRKRKDILDKLFSVNIGFKKREKVFYFDPSKYNTNLMSYDEAERELNKVIKAFPKVGSIRVFGEVKLHKGIDNEGEPYTEFYSEIHIPRLCKLVAFVQDIDYTAPIWANILALILVVTR